MSRSTNAFGTSPVPSSIVSAAASSSSGFRKRAANSIITSVAKPSTSAWRASAASSFSEAERSEAEPPAEPPDPVPE